MSLRASSPCGSRPARGAVLALAVLVLTVVLRAAPVLAADTSAAAPATPPALSASPIPGLASGGGLLPLGGLFDARRLTWHQSLTFGFSSGGAYNGSAGLYTSSFGYRLANPLNLRLDLGASLTPGFRGMGQTQSVFLQGMSLDWQPTKGSFIRFVYQDRRSPLLWGPGMGYGYYGAQPWGDPFSHN